jgi:hypothetical protein
MGQELILKGVLLEFIFIFKALRDTWTPARRILRQPVTPAGMAMFFRAIFLS